MDVANYLKKRIESIQFNLTKSKTNWYLITNSANIKYLSGIESLSPLHREAWLLLSPKETHIFYSPLTAIPAHLKGMANLHVLGVGRSLGAQLKEIIQDDQVESDYADLRVKELMEIEKTCDFKLIASQGYIERERAVKDEYELDKIRKACQITTTTWQIIRKYIQVGTTEKKLQNLILKTLSDKGADVVSEEFLPIVAFGSNSSTPHHQCSDRKLKEEDVVLVDFGCRVLGYWSDMTRTIKLGQQSEEFLKIETTVKQAYKLAINEILKTKKCENADQKVVDFLKSNKYEGLMPHTTGHGIGLEVHEPPSVSRYATQKAIESGVVFTIEPGIYFPENFGYRYENTLLFENETIKTLTDCQ